MRAAAVVMYGDNQGMLFSEEDFGDSPARSGSSERSAEGDGGARENIDAALERLGRSKFRSRFRLNAAEKDYVRSKGLAVIERHAREIVARRLAPAVIPNDGKQTPMRHGSHPVFLAQHATACCCRQCFFKWHGIPAGRKLTAAEQDFAVGLIMAWIKRQTAD